MDRNFEQARGWVLKDEHMESLPGLRQLWDSLDCRSMPAGLDYYLLDCSVCFGLGVTSQWLDLVTATQSPREQREKIRDMGVELVLSGLELFRRRRMKADPEWQRHGSEWSNRCNRARRRALSLAEQGVSRDDLMLLSETA